ncbi:Ent-kaurene synthase, putative [Ricinus communis]|uniref:Ent-kaurene synthase, putative n=1 Tax=Ricinus communis TaxID=3988 RepID=B9T8D0_RICCO|nr:Ent-kaurene synthase, putative [Ricinus communis]
MDRFFLETANAYRCYSRSETASRGNRIHQELTANASFLHGGGLLSNRKQTPLNFLKHLTEYKDLERWVKDCRFDELKFARVLLLYCYYPNTALLVAPELADARLSLAKNFVLATVIDDFFDVDGSQEELENLIQLIERWGETSSVGYCSEQFEIIFPHSKT